MVACLFFFAMGKRACSGAREFVISKMTCVRGGSSSQPVPLPTRFVDNIECVLVSAYSEKGWLPTLLSGQVRGLAVDVVREVQETVMRELHAEAAGAALTPLCKKKGSADSFSPVAEAAATSGKKVGRDALGLSDDSDEDALSCATPRKRAPGSSTKIPTCWTTVKIGDVPIMVRRIEKGRGFLVPVERDLPNLLVYMQKQLEDGSALSQKRRELHGMDQDDKARIRWQFALDSWEIIYVDELGKKHRSIKGFHVSRTNAEGNMLSAEAYSVVREKMLQKARKMWSAMDQSTEARYMLNE